MKFSNANLTNASIKGSDTFKTTLFLKSLKLIEVSLIQLKDMYILNNNNNTRLIINRKIEKRLKQEKQLSSNNDTFKLTELDIHILENSQ